MAYKRISPAPVVEGGTGAATLTDHGVLLGSGTGAITPLGVATDGQLVIGVSGADPALATLTAGTGVSITNAAGSITIASSYIGVYTPVAFGASPYTVLNTDDFIGVDTTGGAVVIKLPNAPTTGRSWVIKDIVGNAAVANITVTTVGGVVFVDSAATFVMNTAWQSINVLFNGTLYLVY